MDDKKDKFDLQEVARGANFAYEIAFTLAAIMGMFVFVGFLLDKILKITFFIIIGAILGSVVGIVYVLLLALKMGKK